MPYTTAETRATAEQVHLDREGKVAILELDNPNGGYLTAHLQKEISCLTADLEADLDVRVIVLTGTAPGTFVTHCSPSELTDIAAVINDLGSDSAVAKLRRQTTAMTRLVYWISRRHRLGQPSREL